MEASSPADTLEEVRALETKVEAQRQYSLPKGLKPCVALMLFRGFGEKTYPKADRAAFIITAELRRLGKSEEEALKVLIQWRNRYSVSLAESKLWNTIQSVYKKRYRIGCDSQSSGNFMPGGSEFCMGKDSCPEYQPSGGSKFKQRKDPWVLLQSGWPKHLRSTDCILYQGVQAIEDENGIIPGSTVYCSYDRLAAVTGLSRNSMKVALQRLEAHGLIRLKIGLPHRWGKTATEVTRIFPLPPVPKK